MSDQNKTKRKSPRKLLLEDQMELVGIINKLKPEDTEGYYPFEMAAQFGADLGCEIPTSTICRMLRHKNLPYKGKKGNGDDSDKVTTEDLEVVKAKVKGTFIKHANDIQILANHINTLKGKIAILGERLDELEGE
jgi:hypothetical protein